MTLEAAMWRLTQTSSQAGAARPRQPPLHQPQCISASPGRHLCTANRQVSAMKRTLVLFASAPLVAALAIFMAVQVARVFMGPDCLNTELERHPSPDGRFDAVIFERGCGATTGFSTQVSVLPRREPPEEAGNLFIATAGDRPVVLGRWGGPLVRVRWHGPDALVIERDPAARRHLEATSVGDVTAVYLPLPSAHPGERRDPAA